MQYSEKSELALATFTKHMAGEGRKVYYSYVFIYIHSRYFCLLFPRGRSRGQMWVNWRS